MAKKKDFGPIVGSWQMVEAWDMNDPGKPGKSYPWGNPPLGYWVYDSVGNVSVQISINPPLPIVDAAWWTMGKTANDDMLASFNNYMAYFGTYTVDEASKTITLQMESSTYPNQLSVSQKRVITTLTAEELKFNNPTPAAGVGQINIAYKRAK